jgi:hypothetical protein
MMIVASRATAASKHEIVLRGFIKCEIPSATFHLCSEKNADVLFHVSMETWTAASEGLAVAPALAGRAAEEGVEFRTVGDAHGGGIILDAPAEAHGEHSEQGHFR